MTDYKRMYWILYNRIQDVLPLLSDPYNSRMRLAYRLLREGLLQGEEIYSSKREYENEQNPPTAK